MRASIVSGKEGIRRAAEILRAGGLAALPTETVYGLAARAFDPKACAEIFAAKGRPLSDPLIVHLPSPDWIDRVAAPSPLALDLAAAFWPGPLTLVLPRSAEIPDIVTAGHDTVAVRVSAHPAFSAVLAELGEPVAAPSANRFGRVSPTEAAHVFEELGDKIPLILDGGPCARGIESTIVSVSDRQLAILRPGPIGESELARFAPVVAPDSRAAAPGRMKSHYAPATRVIFAGDPAPSPEKCGLLAWRERKPGFATCEILAPNGDPATAAATLYAALRKLDGQGLDAIIAEAPPPGDLGNAISDRLRKAAAAG